MHEGQRLRAWREFRGLTQGQLAKRVGRTKATVSLWEQSERAIPPDVVNKVRRAVGLPEIDVEPPERLPEPPKS